MIPVTVWRGRPLNSGATRAGRLLPLWLVGLMLALPLPQGGESQTAKAVATPSTAIRQIISSGRLPAMRWSVLTDVQSGLLEIYEQNHFEPLWIKERRVTPKCGAVLEALRHSAAKGLDPLNYDMPSLTEWAERVRASPEAGSNDTGAFDVAVTANLMRYASALHQGRIEPRQVHFAIHPKDQLDPAEFVQGFLASEQSLSDLLAQIEPMFRGYRRTLAVLERYHQLALQEPAKLPERPRLPLRRGQQYGDLPTLAARLALLGDLKSPAEAGRIYSGAIFDAVKRFQARHGLVATGVVDAVTWKALTTRLSQRVEQLQLTLERWRWLPASVTPSIVVNIPEFELRAYDEKRQLALRMHVIVGKAYRHRTPVFEDKLAAVIIRPWWNIPLSIQRSEMVPELRAHADYLTRNNLQVVDKANQPVSLPPAQDLLDRLQTGDLRLRQEPGPANSLGLLKFDFPNEYSVYMHGTPAYQLFAQSRRDFSHGCIRLEHPEELAEWVLRHDPNWSRERIAAASNGDRTIRVPVSPPVTVLVLYGTAVVEDDGEVRFFEDLYEYDAELKKALESGYPYRTPGSVTHALDDITLLRDAHRDDAPEKQLPCDGFHNSSRCTSADGVTLSDLGTKVNKLHLHSASLD